MPDGKNGALPHVLFDRYDFVMDKVSARPPILPESVLRDAVAHRVTDRSLRRCAREISISPNGLRDFLHGAAPRLSTRSKLERWLAAQTPDDKAPSVAQVVRLVGDLTAELSPSDGDALRREITRFLNGAYESRRQAIPKWLKELSELDSAAARRLKLG